MVMTETIFSDLVQFINTHPQWRRRLLKALFPDLDIAKAFQNLAESQRKTELALQQLTERTGRIEKDVSALKKDVSALKKDTTSLRKDLTTLQDRVERGFAEAAADRAEMKRDTDEVKRDLTQVKRDVADIKGFNYESRIVQHADAIFGRFMRRGHDARNKIGALLEEAEDDGIITEEEHSQVLALDLLWGGKQIRTKVKIVLTVEVSWRAEETDIRRAVSRAKILRKMGLVALPVVAGLVWDDTMIALAHQHDVVIMTDKTVDKLTWNKALE